MLTLNCPECRKSIQADDSYRGKQMICPVCGKTVAIPLPVSHALAESGRLIGGSNAKKIAHAIWTTATVLAWLFAGFSGCSAFSTSSNLYSRRHQEISAIQATQIVTMEIAAVVGLVAFALMMTSILFVCRTTDFSSPSNTK